MVLSLVAGLGLTLWQMTRAVYAERKSAARLEMAEDARDASEDLLTEVIFGMRKKLTALGKADLLADMVDAARGYFAHLPPELVDDETRRNEGALEISDAMLQSFVGDDLERERQSERALEAADELLQQHPDDVRIFEDAATALLSLSYLHVDTGDYGAMADSASRLEARCEAWLLNQPAATVALQYLAIAQVFRAYSRVYAEGGTLVRAAAFLDFQKARSTTRRLREVSGETAAVFSVEGLIRYGDGKFSQANKNHDKAASDFAAAADSFERALNLGSVVGGAATDLVIRGFQAGAWTNQGNSLWKFGREGGDPEAMSRGKELIRQGLEARAALIRQEPRHAEWWRQLSYNHVSLQSIAEAEGKEDEVLEHAEERLRCLDEAVKCQPTRPLLLLTRSTARGSLADQLVKRKPIDVLRVADLSLGKLEDQRRGLELNGWVTDLREATILAGTVDRLHALARQMPPPMALEWWDRARIAVAPLVGKVQGPNDTVLAFAKILYARRDSLVAAGRTAEAEAVAQELRRLESSEASSPAIAHDLVRLELGSIGAELDAILKLPESERAPLLELLRLQLAAVRGKVEQASQRAVELGLENRSHRRDLINSRLKLARLLLESNDEPAALAEATLAYAALDAWIPEETHADSLNGIATDACATLWTALRDRKSPEGVPAMRQILALRQRIEAIRSWPENPDLSSVAAYFSLASFQSDLKDETGSATTLAAALAAAEKSNNSTLLAYCHDRLRGFYDPKGKLDDAERHARLAWEIAQKSDLGWRGVQVTTGFVKSLVRKRKFAEAEQVALPAWDLAQNKTWPGEQLRLRVGLASNLRELYRQWDAASPDPARASAALQWVQMEFEVTPPFEPRLDDANLIAGLYDREWRLAEWIIEGKMDEYRQERRRILDAAKGRANPVVAATAARLALLLPPEGAELEEAASLAEQGFRGAPAAVPGSEWHRLAHGLGLLRIGKPREALDILQPALDQTKTLETLVNLRLVVVLAHQASGNVGHANSVFDQIAADQTTQTFLKGSASRTAATARVLLAEAKSGRSG